MMNTVFSTPYWIMREHEDDLLVELQRTRQPFESSLDAAVDEDRIRAATTARHKTCGMIIDLRLLPDGSSAKAEAEFTRLFAAIARKFARIVVVHPDGDSLDRIFSTMPTNGAETLLTGDDNAAYEFARFGKAPAVDPPSRIRPRIPVDSPIEEALHWARELDEWALLREKRIAELDVRGARAARGLARDLRRIHATLSAVGSAEEQHHDPGPILNELGALRRKAVELIFFGRSSVPDSSRNSELAPTAEAPSPGKRRPTGS